MRSLPDSATSRPLQIPAGCSWSGSGRPPGGVRGHGARWGAHRPHPALRHTPVPGAVAQPALQTRRDQRAPHRAIAAAAAAGGSQRSTSSEPRPLAEPTNHRATDQPGPKDSEATHGAACLLRPAGVWEQEKFRGDLYF